MYVWWTIMKAFSMTFEVCNIKTQKIRACCNTECASCVVYIVIILFNSTIFSIKPLFMNTSLILAFANRSFGFREEWHIDCSISNVLTMEILQLCIKPSIYSYILLRLSITYVNYCRAILGRRIHYPYSGFLGKISIHCMGPLFWFHLTLQVSSTSYINHLLSSNGDEAPLFIINQEETLNI